MRVLHHPLDRAARRRYVRSRLGLRLSRSHSGTLRLGLIAFLILADAALLGSGAVRRQDAIAPAGGHEWAGPPAEDPRVQGAFEVLHRRGLAAALDSLERIAARDSAVMRGAHQTAHALGREAVAQSDGDASVIRQCSPRFASGCYHGVVEASLRARGRIDMAELERMCAGSGGAEQPGPVYECLHGLGHGVLGAAGMDLPLALRDCDALSQPPFQESCHSGAFMEAISAALGGSAAPGMHGHAMGPGEANPARGEQLAIDPRDPYSPCDRFEGPYAHACWLFQGFVILRHNGFDSRAAFRTCDAAPAGRPGPCYESLGHQMAGLFQRDDRWIVAQCAQGRPDLAHRCAGGAALALGALDWSGARAARFCAAAPTAWKETCYRMTAGSLVNLASREGRTELCGRVEPDFAAACREAAGLAGRAGPTR